MIRSDDFIFARPLWKSIPIFLVSLPIAIVGLLILWPIVLVMDKIDEYR